MELSSLVWQRRNVGLLIEGCKVGDVVETWQMPHVCLILANAAIIPSLRFSSDCGLLTDGGATC
jgi:hypothetical protein